MQLDVEGFERDDQAGNLLMAGRGREGPEAGNAGEASC